MTVTVEVIVAQPLSYAESTSFISLPSFAGIPNGYTVALVGGLPAWVAGGGGGGGGVTDLLISNVTTTSLTIESSTGNDVVLTAGTASVAGLISAAMVSKLNAIAAGATANSSDAYLLNRANHTGTQLAATISDFSTQVGSIVAGYGYLTANQNINFTGDITGSGSTSVTLTIGARKVTAGMLPSVATATVRGRASAGSGDIEDLNGTQVTALLNAFTRTLKGLVPPSGGTSGTSNYLCEDGSWSQPTATVADNSLANIKLAQVATKTIKGRASSGTGNVEDLTVAQLLDVISPSQSYSQRKNSYLSNDFYNSGGTNQLPWNANSIGSGTTTTPTTFSILGNRAGVITVRSSTTADSGYGWATSSVIFLKGGEYSSCICAVTNVNAVTTKRYGFGDFSSAVVAVANGVYFQIVATSGGSVVIDGRTASAASRTTTSTSYTATALTFYHLVIELNAAATLATFTVYSESGTQLWQDTLSTNIPTTVLFHVLRISNSGTTANDIGYIDFMDFSIPFTTARGRQS